MPRDQYPLTSEELASMSLQTSASVSRRRFLHAGLATVGLAALSPRLVAEEKDNPYGDFTVGAQSYCFREFNTEQALKKIQELGLRHVEFYQKHAPFTTEAKAIKSLLKLCGEHGITPNAY